MERTIRPLLNVCFVVFEPQRNTPREQPSRGMVMIARRPMYTTVHSGGRMRTIFSFVALTLLSFGILFSFVFFAMSAKNELMGVQFEFSCNTTKEWCVTTHALRSQLSDTLASDRKVWFVHSSCTKGPTNSVTATLQNRGEPKMWATSVLISHSCAQECVCTGLNHTIETGVEKRMITFTLDLMNPVHQNSCPLAKEKETPQLCAWNETKY